MSNIILDDFSPVFVGDTGAAFAPLFKHKDGTAFNLTGATITMKMQHEGGAIKDGLGTWVIDDAPSGRTHYSYDAADLDTVGSWTLFITVTIAGNPVHVDSKLLEVLYAP